MVFLEVAGGLVLLLGGGEVLVRGAVDLARAFGVPPLVVGFSIVAFGTSAPELLVCIEAALGDHPDIVLGNVVGSNIANILLVVGAAAAIRPLLPQPDGLRRDCRATIGLTVLFAALSLLGVFSRPLGGAMVLLLAGYTVWSFRAARRQNDVSATPIGEAAAEIPRGPRSLTLAVLLTIGGIAGVVYGADVLIHGAVAVARLAGLSEAVIGLTLIAVGTSLPELVASVMAALRGHAGLSIGNVMGSNLFNMFGITGATAVVAPVPAPAQVLGFDLWVMLGVTVLIGAALLRGLSFGRGLGIAMIGAYALYVASLLGGFSFAVAG